MKNKKLDSDDPRCPYCNIEIRCINGWGSIEKGYRGGKCSDCQEKITFLYNEYEEVLGFEFTCNEFIVCLDYYYKHIGIGIEDKPLSWIPEFYMDFTNKDRLYSKLKTYVLFL